MRSRSVFLALAATLALAACGAPAGPASPPEATGTAAPTPTPTPTPDVSAAPGGVTPAGDPRDVVTDLASPWSMLRLSDDLTLISQRDDGHVIALLPGGRTRDLGAVPGVVHEGEGGLLGLAMYEVAGDQWLYAYLTTASDNRIVRMRWHGVGRGFGEPRVVLSGIPRARNHNGGRIAFGPDGMLYATVGDAAVRDASQDLASYSGKILRMTPTGAAPDDNPWPGSLVYSRGHRNPQGLAWDETGQLWSAELGQHAWDEFNRIEAGGNYGWPIIEGVGGDPRFIDPVLTWATSDASPSGLAYVDGTFFLAALRGQRVWAIDVADDGSASATAWFTREFGRIRDVTAGPDGTLWILTNNTDGRLTPGPGDDRVLTVRLVPLEEG